MKKWQIAVMVVAVVAVGVGALFGGRAWGANASEDGADIGQTAQGSEYGNASGRTPGDGSGPPGRPGTRNNANMLNGSIIAADDTGITIQTNDGSTKIVLVSESTSINVTQEGSLSDLVTGEDVIVTGTASDDGTVVAASITMGAVLGFGGEPGSISPEGDSSTTKP